MSARQVGSFTLPVVTVLPAPASSREGQQVALGGVPYTFDGTTWQRSGGSSVTLVRGSLDVNVGALPTPEYLTTVAVPGAVVGAAAFGTVAPLAPGKDADEAGLDVIDVWLAVPADGQLVVRLTGLTGHIADAFTVNYLLARG